MLDRNGIYCPRVRRATTRKVDPGREALAAQDFRHATQDDNEKVNAHSSYLQDDLSCVGHSTMLPETRRALNYICSASGRPEV